VIGHGLEQFGTWFSCSSVRPYDIGKVLPVERVQLVRRQRDDVMGYLLEEFWMRLLRCGIRPYDVGEILSIVCLESAVVRDVICHQSEQARAQWSIVLRIGPQQIRQLLWTKVLQLHDRLGG